MCICIANNLPGIACQICIADSEQPEGAAMHAEHLPEHQLGAECNAGAGHPKPARVRFCTPQANSLLPSATPMAGGGSICSTSAGEHHLLALGGWNLGAHRCVIYESMAMHDVTQSSNMIVL